MINKVNVSLYGKIGDKYGRFFSFVARCPVDVIKALSCNFSEFADEFREGTYQFVVDESEISIDECALSFGGRRSISIIPIPEGSKGGMGKVIAGAALIAASVFFPPMAGGAAWAAALGHAGVALGASMALSGVSQMISKTPTSTYENKSDDTKTSTLYDGPVNISGQGLAIQLPYGEVLAGSTVASASISTEKVL